MNKVTKKGWEMSDKTLAPLGFDPRTFGLWAQHATSAPRSNLMYDNYTATYATTRTSVLHATMYDLTSCHNKTHQRYIQYINQFIPETSHKALPSPPLHYKRINIEKRCSLFYPFHTIIATYYNDYKLISYSLVKNIDNDNSTKFFYFILGSNSFL